MSTLSKKLVAICLATAFSMVMYGCGGGGGSSSPAPMDDDDDDMVVTPIECPDGQEPNAANDACVDTAETIAAKVVAATKAAATKKTAIADEAAQTEDEQTARGLGGNDAVAGGDGQQAGSYNLNIEHGETSVVKEAAAEADNETFTQAMDLGGGTTMHVLTMDADDDGDVVEEVVIVSTDIEAPTATAFAMVDGQELDTSTDTTNDSPSTTNEALLLTAVASGEANLPKVMSSAFAANTAAVLTFTSDDTATADEDEAFETAGTYNGAMGTYRCTGGAECTVTINAMGMLSAMTGGWAFIPDEGATSDVPDSDYLHYGFWLQRTTDGDGVLTYDEVETFAGSSVAASGDVSSVTGSATYEGGATGVYVHEVRNPAGNIDTATSGHFTADVALTATFAQTTENDIAPNLLNTLSGTINNFMLSGHDTGPGWSLNLQGDITAGTGTVADGDVGTAPDRDSDGSFTATFHGDVTAGADGTVPKPGSVVGEFGAVFSNGSVAGAFGARED